MSDSFLSDRLRPGGSIRISVGRDQSVTATVDRLERTPALSIVATPQNGIGSIILVYDAGILTGSIRLADSAVAIRPLGKGMAFAADVANRNDAAIACATGNRVDPLEPAICADAPAANPIQQEVVVLVLFTTIAQQRSCRSCQPGEQAIAISNYIELCRRETNAALWASGVPLTILTVSKLLDSYVETGKTQTDLENLEKAAAAQPVATWRADAHADLVSLMVDSADHQGRAHLPTDPISAFAPKALSVVQRAAASVALTFAHEIGHNLGGGHEQGHKFPDGYCRFSHGWLFEDTHGLKFKTIMADTGGYKRVPIFSTREPLFGGVVNGAELADNVRTMHLTARHIAALVK